MIQATGAMRLSRLGKHLPRRKLGVEMGGSASPEKANIVFSAHERRRLRNVRALVREGWLRQGEAVDEIVGGVRYADDLTLMSSVLCPGCLGAFGARLYRAPIRFEVEESGAQITFCDLALWATDAGLEIWRHDPNLGFVLGLEAAPKKVRYPPYLGPGVVARSKLRAWIGGSWHSEMQKTADPGRRCAGVLRPVAELMIQGYPPETLLRAVKDVQSPAVRCARHYSVRWVRALRTRYGDRLDRDAIHDEITDIHKLSGALRHLAFQ
jgi:hypothetical protein